MATIDNGKGVIFDLDGVLIDSGWAHKQAWYDLAEKEDLEFSDKFFNDTFGMQNAQIIPILVGRELEPGELEDMSDWKEQRYRDIVSEKLTLSQGAEKLLVELKEKDFRMAIGSSTPKANLDLIFCCLRLDNYINACVTREDVKNGKPSPETFILAAQKLSLLPHYCVVVEDAVHGIEAAKAAGMPVIALTTTRGREDLSAADIIVDNLDELKVEDFVSLINIQ
jgi:HAD superfamily hydrolase (TIGR01509 family)